jgi:hypothetical protein
MIAMVPIGYSRIVMQHLGNGVNRKGLRALWQWRGKIMTTAIVAAFVAAYLVAPKTAKEIVLPLSVAALIIYHFLITR